MSDSARSDRLTAQLALDQPVSAVHAVSPARARALGKLGISTVRDLLCHFPRRYSDFTDVRSIAHAKVGAPCAVFGTIHDIKLKRPKPHLPLVEICLTDATGTLIVTCFRQPWLMDSLKAGMDVAVCGTVEFSYGFKRMTNPFIEGVQEGSPTMAGSVVPLHPACEKVSAAWMRRIVANALNGAEGIPDPLPLGIRLSRGLASRQTAFRAIHFPQTMEQQAVARRRLAYEEMLMLQLTLLGRARAAEEGMSPVAHIVDGPALTGMRAALPFELTDDQRQALGQILERMASPRRMNHMLLGDVGTGKTIIAALAAAAACDTGGQTMLMAPTEVLARQHAQKLSGLFGEQGLEIGLLTGSTGAADRARLLAAFADGSLQVLIGTHALLEPDVVPARCSLVVIDEQQRFGVDQRQVLMNKGNGADALSLTATPIPRTLALALYGDMTLSYLKANPHGESHRTTRVIAKSSLDIAYSAVRDAVQRGEQAYIVCPLIGVPAAREDAEGEGAAVDYAVVSIDNEDDFASCGVTAASKEADALRKRTFSEFTVELLHGQLPAEEKAGVLERFRRGEADVLVATTVIEVGIDVPNATVMVIQDADRFGLAQLHQLRGRVGRGNLPAQVFLVSSSTNERALDRLKAMERSDDGFELASYDLSLRREGDILGVRQHGASTLKLVSVSKDADLIAAAHDDAVRIIDGDPHLQAPEHQALAWELRCQFPDAAGSWEV